MNLRDLAESDLETTLEDSENGFGVRLTFIDNEKQIIAVGSCADIGFFLDPQTGVGVAGRQVDVSVRMSTILSQTLGDPPDTIWTAQYADHQGNIWKMSVAIVRPDRTLGIFNMTLEAYDDSED